MWTRSYNRLWDATSETFFDSFLFPWARHVLRSATTSLTAPGQPPFRTVSRAVFRIVTAVEKTRASKSHISFFSRLSPHTSRTSKRRNVFRAPYLSPSSTRSLTLVFNLSAGVRKSVFLFLDWTRVVPTKTHDCYRCATRFFYFDKKDPRLFVTSKNTFCEITDYR